jgi:hypothetical protein
VTFINVTPGTSNPTIEVTFDPVNDPLSVTTNWYDITPYLVSYTRNPVRTNEFDQPQPATATLVLRNDDARFTPDYSPGPYYGGLIPYRRFRVRAQWAGVTYNRYFGYATDWPQNWDEAGHNPTVTLQLVDALEPTSTYDLQGQSFISNLSGQALQNVLTVAGISSYSLDTGNSTIAAQGPLQPQSYALQMIQDITATENGVTFADGSGTIQFHDRHRRLVGGASNTVQGTIGDGVGEIPYANPQPEWGDVWPIVQVTPFGGSLQQWTNTTGTGHFFQQTLNFPTSGNYLSSNSTEALSAAQYIANRYEATSTRVVSVDLIGAAMTSAWPTILGLDTSSRVVFRRRPLNDGVPSGQVISLNQFVEGYGDTVVVGQDWRVSVALSPADIQSYWLLGDSTYGLLGETTTLGY